MGLLQGLVGPLAPFLDNSPTWLVALTAAGSLLEEHDQLERGLHSRHIQFMALGGA